MAHRKFEDMVTLLDQTTYYLKANSFQSVYLIYNFNNKTLNEQKKNVRNSLDVSQEYNSSCQSEPTVGTFRPPI